MNAFREMWSPWPKALAVFMWMAGGGGFGFAYLFSLLTPTDFSIALALRFGIPTAVLFMWVLPQVAGRSAASLAPRPDDPERWVRPVQDMQGIGRGGRLILRQRTVEFDASAIELSMGATSWELPLDEIASVEILGRSPNPAAGGFRKRLRLTTHSGQSKMLLTVPDIRQTAADIEAAITSSKPPR